MSTPQIETGIYRHYKKGDLYFVTEIRENHDTGDLWISYNALYSGPKIGYCKKIGLFCGVVPGTSDTKRFSLVQTLPPEKMQMLLPGSLVNRLEDPSPKPYKVESVYQQDSTIFVDLSHWNGGLCDLLSLDSFFQLFVKVSKSE